MKILFDITYIREYFISGIANFSFNLLKGFKENGVQDSVIVLEEEGYGDLFKDRTEGFKILKVKTGMIPYLPFTRGFLFRRKLEKIISEEHIDLLVSPYVYDRTLFSRTIPSIGVIHDTYQMKRQKNFLLKARFNVGARFVCKNLSRIVAISKCDKAEIEGIPYIKTPVEVIYVSVISTADPSKKEGTEPYILNVNTIEPYKNLLTLVRAFNLIKERIPHSLVIKGNATDYWRNVILPFIETNGLQERLRLIESRLSQTEIDKLFVNADLFVTPSTMEGFGFTPIEASLAGVPVISNELPTLVESTRGLVTYYSPATDEKALAEKMLFVLNNRDSVDTGKIRQEYLREYSTERQALKFMELSEKLTGLRF